jgi:hypothetical protein
VVSFVPSGLWITCVAIQAEREQTQIAEGLGDHNVACTCSGNCGSGFCSFRVNLRRYQEVSRICLARPVLGRAYCPRCKCENEFCGRPRNGKLKDCAKRWCFSCSHTSALGRGHHYRNASGNHAFGKTWSPVLKIVASWSFLLPYVTPTDCTAFVSLAKTLGAKPGVHLTTPMFAFLFLAHALKWPPVLQFLGSIIEAENVNSMSATDFLRILRAAMSFANGKTWPAMFHGLFSGLGHATTGMAVALQQLHLIETTGKASEQSTKRRKNTKGSKESQVLVERHISLGPVERQYVVVTDDHVAVDIIEHMLAVDLADCCWPCTAEEATSFATNVLNSTRAVRSHSCEQWGLTGGRDEKHQYTIKHFCRAMMLVVDSYLGPACWDDLDFAKIGQEWTPDECGHAEPLMCMQCRQVRQLFGVSPLLVTCFMCLADDVPEDKRAAALKLPHSELWRVVIDYERALAKQEGEVLDPVVAPGPRLLWERAGAQ